MNPRDHYTTLGVAGVVVVIVFLLVGAVAIGLVSLSDFNAPSFGGNDDNTDNNTTVVTPDSPDDLPPGYQPEGLSVTKAQTVHVNALESLSYSYTHRSARGSQETIVELDVEANGTVTGTETVYDGVTSESTYVLNSEDRVKYTVTHPENGTLIREFANSNYATGIDVIQKVASQDSLALTDVDTTGDLTLYYYTFDAPNETSEGGLVVTENGLVRRAYTTTNSEDGVTVRTELTIQPHSEG